MNEIINNFLLAGDISIPEMHLRQLGFTFSACGKLTKNRKNTKKLKKHENSRYIYKNKLDKASF